MKAGALVRFVKWLSNWRRLLVILAFAFVVFWDGVDIYSIFHQPTRAVGTVQSPEGVPIPDATVVLQARNRIKEEDRFACGTDKEGRCMVSRQVAKGTALALYAFKSGYEPQLQTIFADGQEHEVTLVLKPETTRKMAYFGPSDPVEWWDASDWCDGAVLEVGTRNTATPGGSKDMHGYYLVEVRDPARAKPKSIWLEQARVRQSGTRGSRPCLSQQVGAVLSRESIP